MMATSMYGNVLGRTFAPGSIVDLDSDSMGYSQLLNTASIQASGNALYYYNGLNSANLVLNQPPNIIKPKRFIDELRNEIKSWHGNLN
jgi:hypothetical protein